MGKYEVITVRDERIEERYTVEAVDEDTARRKALGLEPHTIKETNRSQTYLEPYSANADEGPEDIEPGPEDGAGGDREVNVEVHLGTPTAVEMSEFVNGLTRARR